VPPLPPWKKWLFRFLITLVIPAALLLSAEAILRLVGYGHSARFFEATGQPGQLTTNPQFAWQFYSRQTSTTPTPILFNKTKAPDTRRIFVLGESAAAGTPDPAYGFARILELMLRASYPSNRFEVLNVAMRGINSHIILPIARECAELSPDLFVVYMGNNEMIGLHAPSPEELSFTGHRWLLRLGQTIKATRLGQLVGGLFPKTTAPAQDLEYLLRQRLAWDDPKREAIYENFKANLGDICDVIRGAGARGVLATLAVNLRDFPPLGSLHRRDLGAGALAEWEKAFQEGVRAEGRGEFEAALGLYQSAAKIDEHYAELHYRLARCAAASGKTELARKHFGLARDWDALQFRGDSRVNASIRSLAAKRGPQFYLADVEQLLSATPGVAHGVPGGEYFHEHVHFTFDGDYRTAQTLLPVVSQGLGLPDPAVKLPARDECARLLAYTTMDELNVRAAMARQTSKPPFTGQLEHARRQGELERAVQERLQRATAADFEQASAIYREALARHPADWMLHYNYGNLLSQFNKPACLDEYDYVVRQFPRQRAFRLVYGNALLQAGRAAEAVAHFQAALSTDPHFKPALDGLAAARQRVR
jgi:tetratricopeptide (TPR) repeat protein